MPSNEKLRLDENRYFDPDPGVREVARELYEQVRDLPLVCPHGHVDPALLSENRPFPDPTELILIPDHYIFRMLYSRGISLADLGIPARDGSRGERDHRRIWQVFGDHYHLFAGTPTGAWLNHELHEVFGVRDKLDGGTAMKIYDEIREKLESPEFLPRALFDRFNIEVLTTTDAPWDTLAHHRKIRDDPWPGRVIPCFRPDGVVDLCAEEWKKNLKALEEAADREIGSYRRFIAVLEDRRAYFKSLGAVSTDQGVMVPFAHTLSDSEAERIFSAARKGKATVKDGALFTAHLLMEMARMSIEDGLVMQIHAGSYRNHNRSVFEKYGPDKGCDIPITTEFTRNLYELLNTYGNDTRLTLILFTLDESAYARELAPLAGHYPAVRLGPAWWFHDSIEGMIRYRRRVTETAGFYNTVGFNDDTRAFPSIPARHDLARRIDANVLARMVTRHIIDRNDAVRIIRALAYDLAREAYKLA